MQFCSSAVQIVGRLFGIVTIALGGGAGTLTGMVALALATLTFGSALAFAAEVLATVCFCSRSSFSSTSRSCFFRAAISSSVELADCALACETANVVTRAIAILVLCIATAMEAPSSWLEFEWCGKRWTILGARVYAAHRAVGVQQPAPERLGDDSPLPGDMRTCARDRPKSQFEPTRTFVGRTSSALRPVSGSSATGRSIFRRDRRRRREGNQRQADAAEDRVAS